VAYLLEAKHAEAISELQTAVDLCGRGVSWVVGSLGHAYTISGNRAEALRILEELLDRAKRETIDFVSVAAIYAGLRDNENALTALEKACDNRGMSGILAKVDPRFDPLHSEPRFQQILRRMNLG
jgi:predicted Zn-dependent protease